MEELERRLEELIASVAPPDGEAMRKARERQAMLAKPPGSLGRLEDFSIQLAGITGRVHNRLDKKTLLVFAADNGVVSEGVASAPKSVTLRQTLNLAHGKTGAAVLATRFGCTLTVCDVGVDAEITDPLVINRKIARGTGNIAEGPAMTREQALTAILTGAELAKAAEADVLGVGEMGIGNTTTSSAVLSALTGAAPDIVTGRGGGLTEPAFQHKQRTVFRALMQNMPDRKDAVDVLSRVGGFDLAAMCGAFLGGAAARVPVVIDGFISVVAALCAVRLCPAARDYLIPGHASAEPGYALAIGQLGLQPMLLLDMRLGEGSGCPLAFQVLDAACAILNDMATFDEAGIDDGYLDPIRESARG